MDPNTSFSKGQITTQINTHHTSIGAMAGSMRYNALYSNREVNNVS